MPALADAFFWPHGKEYSNLKSLLSADTSNWLPPQMSGSDICTDKSSTATYICLINRQMCTQRSIVIWICGTVNLNICKLGIYKFKIKCTPISIVQIFNPLDILPSRRNSKILDKAYVSLKSKTIWIFKLAYMIKFKSGILVHQYL